MLTVLMVPLLVGLALFGLILVLRDMRLMLLGVLVVGLFYWIDHTYTGPPYVSPDEMRLCVNLHNPDNDCTAAGLAKSRAETRRLEPEVEACEQRRHDEQRLACVKEVRAAHAADVEAKWLEPLVKACEQRLDDEHGFECFSEVHADVDRAHAADTREVRACMQRGGGYWDCWDVMHASQPD